MLLLAEAAPATKRTNEQVWEEMRRLQRLGTEAAGEEGMEDVVEALKQAQMSPFEGLPDKVCWRSCSCWWLGLLVVVGGHDYVREAKQAAPLFGTWRQTQRPSCFASLFHRGFRPHIVDRSILSLLSVFGQSVL